VDRKPGAAVVPVSHAIHPSSSSGVNLKDTSTSINININSNSRGSSLSSNNSTADTTNQEEVSTRGRAVRHLAFLPQQQTRTTKQLQARRRPRKFPLWGTRPLGITFPEESNSGAASFQHPSKTRSTTTSIMRSWLGLQPCKGEPLGGQSNPGCTRCGSRYVPSRITSSKSTI
jgi:hypothetical protein